jgi:hypothetical protein
MGATTVRGFSCVYKSRPISAVKNARPLESSGVLRRLAADDTLASLWQP